MTINLPVFKSVRLRHKDPKPLHDASSSILTTAGTPPLTGATSPTEKPSSNLSKLRKWSTIISCFLLLTGVVFLILVLVAQTNSNRTNPALASTWLIRIDLTNIFVLSTTPGSEFQFLNSIARSLGLHDFYQVGLWNFCEGYDDEGITYCSPPKNLYFFDPVKILLSELLAGATITLPAEVLTILTLIKVASNIMFSFFLLGAIFAFLSLLLSPLALLRSPTFAPRSRSCWLGFALGLVSFFAAFFTVAAAVISTVMFSIMKNVLTSQPMLNINASLGVSMLAFMWVAAGTVLLAFVLQVRCQCGCCCKGRKEKKMAGSREKNIKSEKKLRMPGFIGNRKRRNKADNEV